MFPSFRYALLLALAGSAASPPAAHAANEHWALTLRGTAARKAVEKSLLPYIMQYRHIRSIQFVAEVHENFSNTTIAWLPPRFELRGIYKFWADGDRYRINWRVVKSDYQPITQQLWAFNGARYQSVIGANSLICISRKPNIGGMGPGESNPILSPIQGLCWRATKRRPGDWLNWRRVRHFPQQVDKLPSTIHIGYYKAAGSRAEFSYHYGTLRWPEKWLRKSAPPPSFRPGAFVWSVVRLQRRGNVWLVASSRFAHAAVLQDGRRVGGYYHYRSFQVGRRTLYLPVRVVDLGRRKVRGLLIRHLHINGRIDPAEFTINFGRAVGFWERDRIVNISRLPAAPARTQHLGGTKENGGSSSH